MTDKDVLALKTFPGFDSAAIERYLRDHEDGDATLETWEAHLRNLDSDSSEEDLVWGLGIGVTLFQRVPIKFEYEEVDTSGSSDASAFWLSAAWRF